MFKKTKQKLKITCHDFDSFNFELITINDKHIHQNNSNDDWVVISLYNQEPCIASRENFKILFGIA